MSDNPHSSKIKIKRPSKSWRIHVRRLKREARLEGKVYKQGNQRSKILEHNDAGHII